MLKHSNWRAHSVRVGGMVCLLTMLAGCDHSYYTAGIGTTGGMLNGCRYTAYLRDGENVAVVIYDGEPGNQSGSGSIGPIAQNEYVVKNSHRFKNGAEIDFEQRADDLFVKGVRYELKDGCIFLIGTQQGISIHQLSITKDSINLNSGDDETDMALILSQLRETNRELDDWINKYEGQSDPLAQD